jgi:hypothetical protein
MIDVSSDAVYHTSDLNDESEVKYKRPQFTEKDSLEINRFYFKG